MGNCWACGKWLGEIALQQLWLVMTKHFHQNTFESAESKASKYVFSQCCQARWTVMQGVGAWTLGAVTNHSDLQTKCKENKASKRGEDGAWWCVVLPCVRYSLRSNSVLSLSRTISASFLLACDLVFVWPHNLCYGLGTSKDATTFHCHAVAIPRKCLHFKVSMPGNGTAFEVHFSQLSEVLGNLISSAGFKFPHIHPALIVRFHRFHLMVFSLEKKVVAWA